MRDTIVELGNTEVCKVSGGEKECASSVLDNIALGVIYPLTFVIGAITVYGVNFLQHRINLKNNKVE